MARSALMGGKVRRLRQERGLTQAAMAQRLGISASYLNLIEHNERAVTVALLLKLAKAFDVDLADLAAEDERRLEVALREVFADPGLGQHELAVEEIAALAEASPKAAKAVVELYRAWRTARDDANSLVIGLSGGSGAPRERRLRLPTEEARDFFYDRTNHFPALEEAAEKVRADAGMDGAEPAAALTRWLGGRGIEVAIAAPDALAGGVRRFEPESKRLTLSTALGPASRGFHLAYQAGLLEAGAAIDAIVAEAKLSSREAEALCRVGLANYLAGAVLMPYAPFLAACRSLRYDVEALMQRFAIGFEQACHRLSTLQRPGAKGVPFYLVRVDVAGNISKRFSAAGFHFSRFGGSCPRWVVHDAFTTPGLIRTQLARLPDGATFFSIARTLDRPRGGFREPPTQLAIGIGCDVAHARELVYADAWDLDHEEAATEIGVGCRVCERKDCRQRAFPPLMHRLAVDEKVKGASAYPFTIAR